MKAAVFLLVWRYWRGRRRHKRISRLPFLLERMLQRPIDFLHVARRNGIDQRTFENFLGSLHIIEKIAATILFVGRIECFCFLSIVKASLFGVPHVKVFAADGAFDARIAAIFGNHARLSIHSVVIFGDRLVAESNDLSVKRKSEKLNEIFVV